MLDNLKTRGFDLEVVSLAVEAPENVTAEVARHQIVSAVAHVLKNAFESFMGKPSGPKEIAIHARLVSDDRVEIVVTDHGHWRESDTPAAGTSRGHGLALIRNLAADTDLAVNPDGTQVAMRWQLP